MDEYAIIELLTRVAGRLPPGYAAIGDDVAALTTEPGRLVLKADMLIGRSDVPPGMTPRQVGRKAVAMCISDFASKGVVPRAFMVSLGIPRRMKPSEIRSLAHGFGDAKREWGVHLVGGDTNEAEDLIIDCVVAGFADSIVGRAGARPGDLIVVTGAFGTTSAGLKIALEGARGAPAFRRRALRNVYHPIPRLRVGIALRGYFSSSMDSSDGLAICLHTLAEESGVGMRVDILPHEAALKDFAVRNGYDLEELVLFGGEEYEIVGTIPRERVAEAQGIARSKGVKLIVIGEVTVGKGVKMTDGRLVEKKGWIQLA